jgi:hypothetical protein
MHAGIAEAATYSTAAVALSTPVGGATATYTFTASNATVATPIQCIKATFNLNADGTGNIGTTFSAASATVDATATTLDNGANGSWTTTAATNSVTYTNSANTTAPTYSNPIAFELDGVVNGAANSSGRYLTVQTYADDDCATGLIDTGRVGFVFTDGSLLSLTVDNSLSFSVAGIAQGTLCAGTGTESAELSTSTTLPFGQVTSAANEFACQDVTAATNATNGFTVFARYTAPPTNALSQTISDVSPGTYLSPQSFSNSGVEAYGYTTNDQTLSNIGDGVDRFYNGTTYDYAAMSTTNREVAYSSTGVTSQTNRVTHQVGVSTTTEPGSYTTTVIYTCTPVY